MIGSGLICVTLPTKPRSSSSFSAMMLGPSSPDMPTDWPPRRFRVATMSGFTLPVSTILTTSMVARSVTRSPLRNSALRPSRSLSAVISGPPPCTRTGSIPT